MADNFLVNEAVCVIVIYIHGAMVQKCIRAIEVVFKRIGEPSIGTTCSINSEGLTPDNWNGIFEAASKAINENIEHLCGRKDVYVYTNLSILQYYDVVFPQCIKVVRDFDALFRRLDHEAADLFAGHKRLLAMYGATIAGDSPMLPAVSLQTFSVRHFLGLEVIGLNEWMQSLNGAIITPTGFEHFGAAGNWDVNEAEDMLIIYVRGKMVPEKTHESIDVVLERVGEAAIAYSHILEKKFFTPNDWNDLLDSADRNLGVEIKRLLSSDATYVYANLAVRFHNLVFPKFITELRDFDAIFRGYGGTLEASSRRLDASAADLLAGNNTLSALYGAIIAKETLLLSEVSLQTCAVRHFSSDEEETGNAWKNHAQIHVGASNVPFNKHDVMCTLTDMIQPVTFYRTVLNTHTTALIIR